MSLSYFLKLVGNNFKWLLIIPFTLAFSIYYFTKGPQKGYTSETVIYTGIASGYNLNGDTKVDYFASANAFDNLVMLIASRETKQEVMIRLLAIHLSQKSFDQTVFSWDSYTKLKELVPDTLRAILVKPTLDETIGSITSYMSANDGNRLVKLLNSDNSFYSINALNNISAIRVNSSDLLKITYETNDASICKTTLDVLLNVIIRKHRVFKEGQTGSVIAYFEKETLLAYNKLDSNEQLYLEINRDNDIINFYEQTKVIAVEKGNLYTQKLNLEMESNANTSSLNKINDNINDRAYQLLYTSDVLKEREKLTNLYSKIAITETLAKDTDPVYKGQLDSLNRVAVVMENNLKITLTKLYAQSITPAGVPNKLVLDEWLKSTLSLAQSKGRLAVMDNRKKEFVDEYRKFAPLGATIKKIERQISLAEQAYLEQLHGLSMAKLAQQNNEIIPKLTIVDPPFLPLHPNSSKRILQIILGFLTGIFLVLVPILVNAIINKTLQNPERAKKILGISIMGIYPLVRQHTSFMTTANLRLVQQLLSKMDNKSSPIFIGVISTQKGEGKTSIINMWTIELTALGYKVEKQVWNKNKLLGYASGTNVVFIEFPALSNIVIASGMWPAMHHTILLCRANRIWKKCDAELLSEFCYNNLVPPKAIINGVDASVAEEYIGEMPEDKNAAKAFFSRILKLQFGNKKSISE